MRAARLLALVAMTAGVAVSLPSASVAAAETCHGQPATHVGSTGGGILFGTSGDDVVVSNGAGTVMTGAGNDLVCLTGSTMEGVVWVDVAAGDDTVDATADPPAVYRVTTVLGAGADTYLGSPVKDVVYAQDDSGTPEAVDHVTTGAGGDDVTLGRKGTATRDLVSLGEGNDKLDVLGLPGPGQLDGGPGADTVLFSGKTEVSWFFDNRAQRVSVDETTMPALGLEAFRISLRRSRAIRFLGGAGPETLEISQGADLLKTEVDMGPGADRVELVGPVLGGTFRGGRGADVVRISAYGVGVPEKTQGGADLRAHEVWLGYRKPRDHGHAVIRSFADVDLDHFGTVTVVGDGRDNDITVTACRADVRAGGGDDTVRFQAFARRLCGPIPSRARTADGQGGDDALHGSGGWDTLVGGPGRDRADGGKGVDTCATEVRRRC
jgi:Ca2+-binding RTX toxin-like protein